MTHARSPQPGQSGTDTLDSTVISSRPTSGSTTSSTFTAGRPTNSSHARVAFNTAGVPPNSVGFDTAKFAGPLLRVRDPEVRSHPAHPRSALYGRDELPDNWNPLTDLRTPVWEATQHLVKRLETDGEAAAGQLLRKLGGLGESAQLLAYRLYTICEKARPALAGPYNALVASWPEIQRHAREAVAPTTVNEQQSFDA